MLAFIFDLIMQLRQESLVFPQWIRSKKFGRGREKVVHSFCKRSIVLYVEGGWMDDNSFG